MHAHQQLTLPKPPCPSCGGMLGYVSGGAGCLSAGCAIVLTSEQLERWETLHGQGQRGEAMKRLGILGPSQLRTQIQGVRERIHEPIFDTLEDVSKR